MRTIIASAAALSVAIVSPARGQDDCASLMPVPLDSTGQQADLRVPTMRTCFGGTSDDGLGRVAVGYYDYAGGYGYRTGSWQLYPTDQGAFPSPVASFTGGLMWPTGCTSDPVQSQPQGFTALSCDDAGGPQELRSYNHDGGLVSTLPVERGTYLFAIDPGGGTVIGRVRRESFGFSLLFRRIDAAGVAGPERVIGTGGGSASMAALGVALSGHTLFVVNIAGNPSATGIWLDAAGAPLTSWSYLGRPTALQFLMEGGLASKEAAAQGWNAWYPDGSTTPAALPAWLAARPRSSFAAVRGGRAYAVWGGAVRSGQVELVSLMSGGSCGAFAIPRGDERAGTLTVGRDGTLIQQRPLLDDGSSDDCLWRWWPQVLADAAPTGNSAVPPPPPPNQLPTELLAAGENAAALALDAANIYWVVDTGAWTSAEQTALRMMPKDGSAPPVTLATTKGLAQSVVADDDAVYWSAYFCGSPDGFCVSYSTRYLFRMSKADGSVALLANGASGELALDDANVYFVSAGGPAGVALSSVPKTGGAVSTLLANVDSAGHVAVDQTFVYATRGQAIVSVPKRADPRRSSSTPRGSGRSG